MSKGETKLTGEQQHRASEEEEEEEEEEEKKEEEEEKKEEEEKEEGEEEEGHDKGAQHQTAAGQELVKEGRQNNQKQLFLDHQVNDCDPDNEMDA
ncbi:hypothetical protein NQZ68_035634 [Dissostichus eleginoides]|nr:hypothetical protein NQZ68_035634 [Dissostichus eleginoides]